MKKDNVNVIKNIIRVIDNVNKNNKIKQLYKRLRNIKKLKLKIRSYKKLYKQNLSQIEKKNYKENSYSTPNRNLTIKSRRPISF